MCREKWFTRINLLNKKAKKMARMMSAQWKGQSVARSMNETPSRAAKWPGQKASISFWVRNGMNAEMAATMPARKTTGAMTSNGFNHQRLLWPGLTGPLRLAAQAPPLEMASQSAGKTVLTNLELTSPKSFTNVSRSQGR